MAFKAVSEVFIEQGIGDSRRGNRPKDEGVYISTNAQKAQVSGWRNVVRITDKVCSEARLMEGDRVAIDVDREARMARIRRVPEGANERSWILSNPNKKSRKAGRGLLFTFTWAPGIPSFANTTRCEHVIESEGIILEIPVSAGWGRCIREK